MYDSYLHCVCDEREFSTKGSKKLSHFVDALQLNYDDSRCCCEVSFGETALYDALTALGADCAIIAPGTIPRRHRDRIKTGRRDARKLAPPASRIRCGECKISLSDTDVPERLIPKRICWLTSPPSVPVPQTAAQSEL